MTKEPVFICGLARSGTTWLAESLAQSEELIYLKETWLLRKLKDLGDWHSFVYREWSEFTPWHDSGIDQQRFYQHMSSFVTGLLCEMSGGQRFLEKTPIWNLLYFDTLRELFPNAYFIFIYRDGRNYVASSEAKAIRENKPFDFIHSCSRWAEAMHIVASLSALPPTVKTHMIRYEDLTRDFYTAFSLLCRLVEIREFTPDKITPNSSFSNASKSDDFNNRWKSWSEERRDIFNKIAGKELREWGYLS